MKHLVLCRIERRPPKLDTKRSIPLPRVAVTTTSAGAYMAARPAHARRGAAVLLTHHLKALKLPTFREHDKLARQCAAEGVATPATCFVSPSWSSWIASGGWSSGASARRASRP